MFIDEEPLHCRVCDSTQNERFHRKSESGIRCLRCGHEQITETSNLNRSGIDAWATDNTKRQF